MAEKTKDGKLKIGDDWNAIVIIARSQANPYKAIAELVENSIDAYAKRIIIVRAREKGEIYIRVSDDGEGVPLNIQKIPDFDYVATHICDSIKRKFSETKRKGIHGHPV